MTPIGELRAGIPYGLVQGLNPILTYMIAVLGNMMPVVFLLWGLPAIELYNRKAIKPAKINKKDTKIKKLYSFTALQLYSFYSWYKSRTKRKYSKRFARLGAFALISFVAIPLPITGAWTGTLAAYIFGIQPKKALALILAGVMIAGVIITLISMGLL